MADGIKVSVDFRNLKKKIKEQIADLSSAKGVKSGYFKGKSYDNGLELARNALIQEKGDPIHNIPPRPFLSNTVENYKNEWKERLIKDLKAGLPLETALVRVGLLMQNNIADQIDATLTPPNSPRTIQRKKSSHPLIDTGKLKNSITFEVLK